MGGHNIEMIKKGELSRSKVDKLVQRAHSEDAHGKGHSAYSGGWNTCSDFGGVGPSKVFDSFNEAWEYLSDNVRKHEYGYAYFRDLDTAKLDKDKTLQKLEEQFKKAKNRVVELEQEACDNIKSAKSKTVGCTGCESKLNRQYVKNAKCPLCGEDLRSDTNKKRIKAARKKAREIEKKARERHDYLAEKKGEINTIIYGYAAS